ncbi:hypothetical protein C7M84_021254 [Penaeus vannamei]|uniref:Uncharacterized protein n=1 Tax=Penaeus vannamei TaxID=6689 RepID=A0A423S9Y3_PENVA|nr:hypothetical protein C7M84_021254 [Penaeus vannamei]
MTRITVSLSHGSSNASLQAEASSSLCPSPSPPASISVLSIASFSVVKPELSTSALSSTWPPSCAHVEAIVSAGERVAVLTLHLRRSSLSTDTKRLNFRSIIFLFFCCNPFSGSIYLPVSAGDGIQIPKHERLIPPHSTNKTIDGTTTSHSVCSAAAGTLPGSPSLPADVSRATLAPRGLAQPLRSFAGDAGAREMTPSLLQETRSPASRSLKPLRALASHPLLPSGHPPLTLPTSLPSRIPNPPSAYPYPNPLSLRPQYPPAPTQPPSPPATIPPCPSQLPPLRPQYPPRPLPQPPPPSGHNTPLPLPNLPLPSGHNTPLYPYPTSLPLPPQYPLPPTQPPHPSGHNTPCPYPNLPTYPPCPLPQPPGRYKTPSSREQKRTPLTRHYPELIYYFFSIPILLKRRELRTKRGER